MNMPMFRKKSTKEMVQGVASPVPESTPAREKKPKKERTPKDGSRYVFFRTRTFYGILAIILGVVISLVGIPAIQQQVAETVEVFVFNADATAGSQITEDMLTTVELAAYHLPAGTISDAAAVTGQYLRVDAVAGDFVTGTRLSEEYPGDDPELVCLPEGKVAISISLPDLAQSVSGKLRKGDVIQIFAVDNSSESTTASMPEELRYVEVLAVTYADGIDVGDESDSNGSSSASNNDTLAAVTLLVNPTQAARLTGLEHKATLYAALVIRGDDARKEEVLAVQDEFFAAMESAATTPGDDVPSDAGTDDVDAGTANGEEVG